VEHWKKFWHPVGNKSAMIRLASVTATSGGHAEPALININDTTFVAVFLLRCSYAATVL